MKIIATALLAAALLSGAANAATVTYFSNVHTTSTTNWSDVLNFTKFDPSLGTLTSIKVTTTPAFLCYDGKPIEPCE